MSKTTKRPSISESEQAAPTPISSSASLVFISHDSRDAVLAEAFSKLLSSVSCGVLKSFRSSDHKTTQGIEYGVEWYPAIRTKINEAGDVVALLTPRSFERPWILFECGIARGKLDERGRQEKKIKGLAIGLPLTKIAGPFAQFQNCPFEIAAITKLVMELVAQIPNAEPDREAIEMQTKQFFEKAKGLVDATEEGSTDEAPGVDDTSVAKLFEEVKVMFQDLPSRVEDRISDAVSRPFGRRKGRRLHPMMFEEFMHMGGSDSGDPIAILLAASTVRDEMPWLYEMAREVYQAIKSGDGEAAERQANRLGHLFEMMMRGPFMEEFGGSKDAHVFMMEFPRLMERLVRHSLETKKSSIPRKRLKPDAGS
jgi:hypothetical protein